MLLLCYWVLCFNRHVPTPLGMSDEGTRQCPELPSWDRLAECSGEVQKAA